MKRIYILFFQLFILLQIVVCQNEIIYELGKIRLSINAQTNKYSIWEDNVNTNPYSNSITSVPDISAGKITIDSGLITCNDTIYKNRIVFKQLDEYRLLVINKNHCFKVNDILYAIVISDKNGKPYQWMKWKNGKKHGEWSIHCDKGVNFTLYDKGKIIKTYFKTYKEIGAELLNGPVSL